MYLAIILLLVQYRFHNHWSEMQKYGQQIKVNQQQVNIRCFAIIVVQKKNMNFLSRWFIFALTFIFYVRIFLHLSVINFSPGF